MSESGEESLFEALGIDRESLLPTPSDGVWEGALTRAVDPQAPDVDDDLVPSPGEHAAGGAHDVDAAFDADDNHSGNGHDLGHTPGHVDLSDLFDGGEDHSFGRHTREDDLGRDDYDDGGSSF